MKHQQISTAQGADLSGFSKSTIAHWANMGYIKADKNGSWKINQRFLEAYVGLCKKGEHAQKYKPIYENVVLGIKIGETPTTVIVQEAPRKPVVVKEKPSIAIKPVKAPTRSPITQVVEEKKYPIALREKPVDYFQKAKILSITRDVVKIKLGREQRISREDLARLIARDKPQVIEPKLLGATFEVAEEKPVLPQLETIVKKEMGEFIVHGRLDVRENETYMLLVISPWGEKAPAYFSPERKAIVFMGTMDYQKKKIGGLGLTGENIKDVEAILVKRKLFLDEDKKYRTSVAESIPIEKIILSYHTTYKFSFISTVPKIEDFKLRSDIEEMTDILKKSARKAIENELKPFETKFMDWDPGLEWTYEIPYEKLAAIVNREKREIESLSEKKKIVKHELSIKTQAEILALTLEQAAKMFFTEIIRVDDEGFFSDDVLCDDCFDIVVWKKDVPVQITNIASSESVKSHKGKIYHYRRWDTRSAALMVDKYAHLIEEARQKALQELKQQQLPGQAIELKPSTAIAIPEKLVDVSPQVVKAAEKLDDAPIGTSMVVGNSSITKIDETTQGAPVIQITPIEPTAQKKPFSVKRKISYRSGREKGWFAWIIGIDPKWKFERSFFPKSDYDYLNKYGAKTIEIEATVSGDEGDIWEENDGQGRYWYIIDSSDPDGFRELKTEAKVTRELEKRAETQKLTAPTIKQAIPLEKAQEVAASLPVGESAQVGNAVLTKLVEETKTSAAIVQIAPVEKTVARILPKIKLINEDLFSILSVFANITTQITTGTDELDKIGFNSFDAAKAKKLIKQYPNWTAIDEQSGWDMLLKYKRQLTELGIDYDKIKAIATDKSRESTTTLPVGQIKKETEDKVFIDMIKNAVSEIQIDLDRAKAEDQKLWLLPFDIAIYDSAAYRIMASPMNAKYTDFAYAIHHHKRRFAEFPYPSFQEKVDAALIDYWGAYKNKLLVDLEIKKQRAIEKEKAIEAEEQHAKESKVLPKIESIPGLLHDVPNNNYIRDYQLDAVAYAINRKRTWIADDMGVGKTIEAIATLQYLNAYPALVVSPATMKYKWQDEIQKWLLGKRSTFVIEGKTKEYEDADIVIINYDIMNKHLNRLIAVGFKAIVFDESHRLKNKTAQRTKTALELVEKSKIPYRFLLSGTPYVNDAGDTVSQLQILGNLAYFGGENSFNKEYRRLERIRIRGGRTISVWKGVKNEEQLNHKLRDCCMIRRRKEEVLKELPPMSRSIVSIELSNKAEYRRAEKEIFAWIREYKGDDAANAATQAEHLVKINYLRQLSGHGKIEAAISFIENTIEQDEKIIVFAWHNEVIKGIKEKFPDALIITGDTPAKERTEHEKTFQTDKTKMVMLLNIKAGGEGITLTAASNVLFVELAWTSTAQAQAEGRAWRHGQTKPVTAWYLLGKDTNIDDYMYNIILNKRNAVEKVTDGRIISSEEEKVSQEGVLSALIKKIKKG